jgi:hypothetical protein
VMLKRKIESLWDGDRCHCTRISGPN